MTEKITITGTYDPNEPITEEEEIALLDILQQCGIENIRIKTGEDKTEENQNTDWILGNNFPSPGWYWIVVSYDTNEFPENIREKIKGHFDHPMMLPDPFPYGLSGYYSKENNAIEDHVIAFCKIEKPHWDKN